ncbi:Polyketide cyclase / dehydrase and lipid transport [Streptomyces sp. YIM 130001]|uniref:SRPBCC family protein n=1 Tax=Streptomyces sp. YIM 130001 TaxID=2259644 RepID=UPI000E64BF80|nr:SRPBCC family protein [Streptomyces sp. YIM 130001]RII08054.1 Polyketide cyclase / dehydrase and lipid transport [Streptomyces sp. YIM 130001]
MARRLSPVGLEFIETAPLRFTFTREIGSPPAAVYRALAEDVEGWPAWFKAVSRAQSTDDAKGRSIKLRVGVHFAETILAADPDERYAYRVDATNAPGVRHLVEEWRLTPASGGTRVRWTFAADGSAAFRIGLRAARPGLGSSFRDAVTRLDSRLSGTPA